MREKHAVRRQEIQVRRLVQEVCEPDCEDEREENRQRDPDVDDAVREHPVRECALWRHHVRVALGFLLVRCEFGAVGVARFAADAGGV